MPNRPVPRGGISEIRGHMVATAKAASKEGIFIASNESAYGPGNPAREAIITSAGGVERYPEEGTVRLATAIGARFSINPAKICCGFGSDDLLARLARAYLAPGDELIHTLHGYPKIPNYAYANDANPVAANDKDFTADVDAILEQVTEHTRIIMLANPDNPAGTYLSGAEVRRLHANLDGRVLLVLDSAYAEYADAADYEDPTKLVESSNNVVMTRTFSKVFGLAGLRVGWVYGPDEIIDTLARIGITFPVSVAALAACEAALADHAHFDMVVRENSRIREMFSRELSGLGVNVIPSQTNFVLAQFEDSRRAAEAHAALETEGIFARRLVGGDFSKCIRFTMGTDTEMNQCIFALAKWLGTRD